MSTDAPKLSPVETIKEGSDYLKGTIDPGLIVNPEFAHV